MLIWSITSLNIFVFDLNTFCKYSVAATTLWSEWFRYFFKNSNVEQSKCFTLTDFDKESKVGNTRRFDIDQAYVVAAITGITPAGLAPVSKVADRVKPILIKEKKAVIIKEKMKGATLSEIAKTTNTTIKTANVITQETPMLDGIGFEPGVVGAMSSAKLGTLVNGIVGNQGVYAVSVSSREVPPALPSYELNRKNILKQLQSRGGQLYNALKEASDIKDYRTNVY